jgi:hypothetical protein
LEEPAATILREGIIAVIKSFISAISEQYNREVNRYTG